VKYVKMIILLFCFFAVVYKSFC